MARKSRMIHRENTIFMRLFFAALLTGERTKKSSRHLCLSFFKSPLTESGDHDIISVAVESDLLVFPPCFDQCVSFFFTSRKEVIS